MPFPDKSLLMLDLNARIAFASSYFCDLVRSGDDEVAGVSFLDFALHEDRDQAKRLLQKSNSRNGPFGFRLRRTDGAPVLVNVQGAALYTAAGELYGISVAITGAQSHEEALLNRSREDLIDQIREGRRT